MEPGRLCLCGTAEPTDPAEYLEMLKKKHLIRTAKLQEQEMQMERKMGEIDALIGPRARSHQSPCNCDIDGIPRMTNVRRNQEPVTQQCSFFQRMTENIRSILASKCQRPSTFLEGTSTSSFTPGTETTTSTTTFSETLTKSYSDFTEKNMVDYDSSLSDQASRSSISTCDFTDSSTLQNLSCSNRVTQANLRKIPKTQQVSICPRIKQKGNKSEMDIQTGDPVQIKSIQIGQEISGKSVLCCSNTTCLNEPGTGRHSGVQVANHTRDPPGFIQSPKKIICDVQQQNNAFQENSKLACQASWTLGRPTCKDRQNQCALIGFPLLEIKDRSPPGKSFPIYECNTSQGAQNISNYTVEMQNNANQSKKGKHRRIQSQESRMPDKHCSRQSDANSSMDLEKLGRELRIENQMLKCEFEATKLELKRCLEKLEVLLNHWLQAEKKCEEMTELKLQLCCAYSNFIELNRKTQRLKDDMAQLDYLCQALRHDLIQQNIDEAETIKRLTSGKNSAPSKAKSEEFKYHSNLEVIARKLSKTLKDVDSCEECSNLPAELVGTARCIKELADMVRKMRIEDPISDMCNCQKRPSKEPSNISHESLKFSSPAESFIEKGGSSNCDVPRAEFNFHNAKREPPCAKFKTSSLQSKGVVGGIRDVSLIEDLTFGPGPGEDLVPDESDIKAESFSDVEFSKARKKGVPFKERRCESQFSHEEENKMILDESPMEMHMTTTIALSGLLEVLTEGPEGTIGTTLTYTEEGNIEVITEMTDLGEGEISTYGAKNREPCL
ncbi:uncharacterized protein [Euwallacea fornicatus]|uniref:uncharacterized protein n=1 Tax=Euwallacea fornicatus TaxID=995702 RepID=UPI00338DF0ED